MFKDAEKTFLEEKIRPYLQEEASFNAFITRGWDHEADGDIAGQTGHSDHKRSLPPFIGNGYFGIYADSDAQFTGDSFFISGKRGLESKLPFYPIVKAIYQQGSQPTIKGVSILRLTHGILVKISAFKHYDEIVSIQETFYAHRLIPCLLMQEVSINNPSAIPIEVKFKRTGWATSQAVQTSQFKLKDSSVYKIHSGSVQSYQGSRFVFSIAAPDIPSEAIIGGREKKTFSFRTLLNYTLSKIHSNDANVMGDINKSIVGQLTNVNSLMSTLLYQSHVDSWHDIWSSGFGLSLSKASDALNGDKINATIYYILSHKKYLSRTPREIVPETVQNFPQLSQSWYSTKYLIDHPDRCYAGNPTLQAPSLWSTNLNTETDVNHIVSLWLLTLEKNGCINLLSSGAKGTLQAILLSFVGMQHHMNHLDLSIHPKELHRDYFIRRIRYSNGTNVNVTMIVGEDNKASIFVILDSHKAIGDMYACDAGCLDPPVKLSNLVEKQFPVKLTEPLTPILYIASNKVHIEELKHAIHVKEVAIAPPHETHLIALHRHGHRLGGLPTFFWAAIFILIVIFHFFLAKLIYKEFYGESSASGPTYERLRRAV